MASLSFSSVFLLLIILCYSLSLSSSSPSPSLPLDEVEDESHFGYIEGRENGPENWGKLEWEWRVCSSGKMQSPIDLTAANRVVVSPRLGKLKGNYIHAPAVLKNRGHDIMVEWTRDGGYIQIDGTHYNLKQCHWHTPSEHAFTATRHAMELHLVHRSSDDKIAVVAITYKFGSPDRFLSKVIPHVGRHGIGNVTDLGIIKPRVLRFGNREYYRYMGSLTTPPCTEGVIWTVMKKVRTVSKKQVKAMREAVKDGFAMNARPIQDLNGRTVWLYQG